MIKKLIKHGILKSIKLLNNILTLYDKLKKDNLLTRKKVNLIKDISQKKVVLWIIHKKFQKEFQAQVNIF